MKEIISSFLTSSSQSLSMKNAKLSTFKSTNSAQTILSSTVYTIIMSLSFTLYFLLEQISISGLKPLLGLCSIVCSEWVLFGTLCPRFKDSVVGKVHYEHKNVQGQSFVDCKLPGL